MRVIEDFVACKQKLIRSRSPPECGPAVGPSRHCLRAVAGVDGIPLHKSDLEACASRPLLEYHPSSHSRGSPENTPRRGDRLQPYLVKQLTQRLSCCQTCQASADDDRKELVLLATCWCATLQHAIRMHGGCAQPHTPRRAT